MKLCGYVLGGIGLQISMVLASSSFGSVPIDSLPPALPQHAWPSSSAITAPLAMRKKLPTPRVADASPYIAFVARQLSRYKNNDFESGGAKHVPNIDSQPLRFVPTLQHSTSSSRLSPRLYMLPEDDILTPDILTPETYANSRMAERQVEDTIFRTAFEAFDSTDFAHEPHLSPELEAAEAAYEVALLASAAHGLANAAEKENQQSKAAMLEREKELAWIEKHGDENDGGAQQSSLAP
ncbi:hypothetical protein ACHAXR_013511 [Thalassiosira sp. AJA248-18]